MNAFRYFNDAQFNLYKDDFLILLVFFASLSTF